MNTKVIIADSCKNTFNGTDEQFNEIVNFITEKFESGELYVIDVEDEDDENITEEV